MGVFFAFGVTDPQWPAVFNRIRYRTGLDLAYCTAMSKRAGDYSRYFPNATFHLLAHAYKGIAPVEMEQLRPAPVGTELLDYLQPFKHDILKLMDRMETPSSKLPLAQRERHYYNLVCYWKTILEKFSPAFCFFPITPHAPYDLICYHLSRFLGIENVILDRTALPGRILIKNDYMAEAPDLAKSLAEVNGQRNFTLPEDLRDYLAKLRDPKTNSIPSNMKSRIESMGKADLASISEREKFSEILKYEIAHFKNHVLRGNLTLKNNYFVEHGKNIEDSEYTIFQDIHARYSSWSEKRRLRENYKNIQKSELHCDNYIFFGLHYQPERNSLPIGGVFADQMIIIRMISASLPEGWRLLVKEHNMQWSYFKKGNQGRSVDFYRDVAKLPNVDLVPVNLPSDKLIANAKATATIAGSIGWESINAGVPCLLFGASWYQSCEGIYRISTTESLQTALSDIAMGKTALSMEKIDHFAKQVDDAALKGVIDTMREPADSHAEGDKIGDGLVDYIVRRDIAHDARPVVDHDAKPVVDNAAEARSRTRLLIFVEQNASSSELALLASRLKLSHCFEPVIYCVGIRMAKRMDMELKGDCWVRITPRVPVPLMFKHREGGSPAAEGSGKEEKGQVSARKSRNQLVRHFPTAFGLFMKSKFRMRMKILYYGLLTFSQFFVGRNVFEYFHTRIRIREARAQWEGILAREAPACILVADDRTVANAPGIISAAEQARIPTALAQYALVTPKGGAHLRSQRPLFQLDRGPMRLVKRWAEKHHPEQIYRHESGKRLMFNSPGSLLALHRENATLPRPWAAGGGRTSIALLIDDAERRTALNAGGDAAKIRVVGQASMDQLWEIDQHRDEIAKDLYNRFALHPDRPNVVFAVPHYAEHRMMSWDQHLGDLGRIFDYLNSLEVNVILSPHPRADLKKYQPLLEKYGWKFNLDSLRTFLPIADIFLATFSSTVRWALMLGIPSIVIDTHKFGLDYFENETDLLIVQDMQALADHVETLISDLAALRALRVERRQTSRYAPIFDGKCVERIAHELDTLIKRHNTNIESSV